MPIRSAVNQYFGPNAHFLSHCQAGDRTKRKRWEGFHDGYIIHAQETLGAALEPYGYIVENVTSLQVCERDPKTSQKNSIMAHSPSSLATHWVRLIRVPNEAPRRQRRGINSLKLGCAASCGELTPLWIRNPVHARGFAHPRQIRVNALPSVTMNKERFHIAYHVPVVKRSTMQHQDGLAFTVGLIIDRDILKFTIHFRLVLQALEQLPLPHDIVPSASSIPKIVSLTI